MTKMADVRIPHTALCPLIAMPAPKGQYPEKAILEAQDGLLEKLKSFILPHFDT